MGQSAPRMGQSAAHLRSSSSDVLVDDGAVEDVLVGLPRLLRMPDPLDLVLLRALDRALRGHLLDLVGFVVVGGGGGVGDVGVVSVVRRRLVVTLALLRVGWRLGGCLWLGGCLGGLNWRDTTYSIMQYWSVRSARAMLREKSVVTQTV